MVIATLPEQDDKKVFIFHYLYIAQSHVLNQQDKMLKIIVKIRPDNNESHVGNLVAVVDDGKKDRIVVSKIRCPLREAYSHHFHETVHFVKHLYSVAETFYNCGMPLIANEIVSCFNDTYNPNFSPDVLDKFKTDDKGADVTIEAC